MKKTSTNIGIILRPDSFVIFQNLLPILTQWLLKRGYTVCFLEKELPVIQKIYSEKIYKKFSFQSNDSFYKSKLLIISLGGDGTLIGVARELRHSSIPIFGVNLGNLGFLTEFSKSDLYDSLHAYIKGELSTEPVQLYTASVRNHNTVRFQDIFINDAVIGRHHISRMIRLGIEVGDELFTQVSGDGLIVSSPIGSTAYSLAAGGPIVYPKVKALTLTPICPHTIIHRPIVLSDDFKIKLRSLRYSEGLTLTLDGQSSLKLEEGDVVEISKKTRSTIHLVKNPKRSYFQTLKEKFLNSRN